MKKSMMIIATASMLAGMFAAMEATAGAEGRCKACHTYEQGAGNKVGPNLFGVMGRKAGSVEGFKYGSYLANADFSWDEAKIREFINDSKGMAKAAGGKSKMSSQKLTGAAADEVIAFLNSLK